MTPDDCDEKGALMAAMISRVGCENGRMTSNAGTVTGVPH